VSRPVRYRYYTIEGRKVISQNYRVNERIRAREIRLIGEHGENQLMFTRDAIAEAKQRGLDLVEVAPNAVPPVCKIMDYGKFKYEQTKKDRDSRKTQKSVVVKEVRFSPKIDEHDIDTKTRMAKRFLDEGNKVKLTVKFKGRELAHTNLGRDLLQQVQMMLGDNIIVEAPSKMEGKSMTMMVSLKPPKGGVSKPKPAAAPQAQAAAPVQAPMGSPMEAPMEAEPVAAGANPTTA
jgi:translation initiation factor IF-3